MRIIHIPCKPNKKESFPLSTKKELLYLPKRLHKKAFFIFFSLALLLFTTLIMPNTIYAKTISLKVAPSTLQIRAEKQQDIKALFILENQSNESVKVDLGYKLFNPKDSQEGRVVFLHEKAQNTQNKIFRGIQIQDMENVALNSIELGPKQQKQLQLRIQIPKDQPSGDTYFSLILLTQADQNQSEDNKSKQSTSILLQEGIGINILLAVGAQEMPQATIEDFSTSWMNQSGPISFNLRVKNNGLHFIKPHGVIFIKNMFNQTVGRVDVPETTILADTSRTISQVKLSKNTSNNLTKSLAIIAWPEQFLLGTYRAELNLSLSDKGPTYTQTTRFFVFPLQHLLIIITSGAIGTFIYLRVKRKTRK